MGECGQQMESMLLHTNFTPQWKLIQCIAQRIRQDTVSIIKPTLHEVHPLDCIVILYCKPRLKPFEVNTVIIQS